MLFNSLVFIVFAVGFFAAWPLVRRQDNTRWLFLVAASFLFYGWWSWHFLFLILGVALVNYYAVVGMTRWPAWNTQFLFVSFFASLGPLFLFKYLDFGLANVNCLLDLLGVQFRVSYARLVLPVGISFYTFQAMSYTIDVFRGNLTPARTFMQFLAYLSMFPQLVAGPIVRASCLLPQLETGSLTTEKQRWDGFTLIAAGYFKKVVVADNLAPLVNDAFSQSGSGSCIYWWLVMTMFAFQIYCDFSGYSDIARGLANWMGYTFPLNFNHPYVASSIHEFWSRWHISLSTWFRDYVYIPLGGSRHGPGRAVANLWITMVVSGLWHGAAWTFVVWGALHAFYVTVERITRWPEKIIAIPLGRHLATFITFQLVLVSWVLFRATSIEQAIKILEAMFGLRSASGPELWTLLGEPFVAIVPLMLLWELVFHFRLNEMRWNETVTGRWFQLGGVAILLVLCVFLRGPGGAFVYFQF